MFYSFAAGKNYHFQLLKRSACQNKSIHIVIDVEFYRVLDGLFDLSLLIVIWTWFIEGKQEKPRFINSCM